MLVIGLMKKKLIGKKLQEFKKLVKQTKQNSVYDCIVPCSGGKDGTYVSNRIKSLGYNPLIVNSQTTPRNKSG